MKWYLASAFLWLVIAGTFLSGRLSLDGIKGSLKEGDPVFHLILVAAIVAIILAIRGLMLQFRKRASNDDSRA